MDDTTGMTIEDVAREERKKYYREWRVKNREKVKLHQETYWKKRAIQKIKGQEG